MNDRLSAAQNKVNYQARVGWSPAWRMDEDIEKFVGLSVIRKTFHQSQIREIQFVRDTTLSFIREKIS